jgi:hypothetical protein
LPLADAATGTAGLLIFGVVVVVLARRPSQAR